MAILNPQEAFFTQFEPIQKNRFQVTIPGIEPFLVASVTIPTPTSNVIVVDHINIQQKFKGKSSFGSFSMSIYNAIAPSSMQAIYEWYRLSHESYGRDGYKDLYAKSLTVSVLSPVLETVSQFNIVGAWISSISGLDFDKSADGLVNITITCECDYCELEF
jgi:hypothetical protein